MFTKTTLRNIAITKQLNFNNDNIVANKLKTSYSLKIYSKKITSLKKSYEWDEKLE